MFSVLDKIEYIKNNSDSLNRKFSLRNFFKRAPEVTATAILGIGLVWQTIQDPSDGASSLALNEIVCSGEVAAAEESAES